MKQKFSIRGRSVSADKPCYIIGEVGVNHNGDAAIAHALVEEARAAGVDAVKFQMFDANALASKFAKKAEYQLRETGSGSQLDMLEKLSLTMDEFGDLKAHCDEKGIDFICTAFDTGSLANVLKLRPACLKWPSGEINNLAFIKLAAESNLPMIMSTGMATLSEIAEAVETFFESSNNCNLALLQCVSAYPAPTELQNLNCIPNLSSAFGLPVGFSDHTEGLSCAIAARALGMCILEKHFTLDRTMDGPDHMASIEPKDLRKLVGSIRDVESALGDGIKRPTKVESAIKAVARKSLVYRDDMPVGHVLKHEDIVIKRPGTGLAPSQLSNVIGKSLNEAVKFDQIIELSHLR